MADSSTPPQDSTFRSADSFHAPTSSKPATTITEVEETFKEAHSASSRCPTFIVNLHIRKKRTLNGTVKEYVDEHGAKKSGSAEDNYGADDVEGNTLSGYETAHDSKWTNSTTNATLEKAVCTKEDEWVKLKKYVKERSTTRWKKGFAPNHARRTSLMEWRDTQKFDFDIR